MMGQEGAAYQSAEMVAGVTDIGRVSGKIRWSGRGHAVIRAFFLDTPFFYSMSGGSSLQGAPASHPESGTNLNFFSKFF